MLAGAGMFGIMGGLLGQLSSEVGDPGIDPALKVMARTLDRVAPTLALAREPNLVSATDGVSAVLGGVLGSVSTIVAGMMAVTGEG